MDFEKILLSLRKSERTILFSWIIMSFVSFLCLFLIYPTFKDFTFWQGAVISVATSILLYWFTIFIYSPLVFIKIDVFNEPFTFLILLTEVTSSASFIIFGYLKDEFLILRWVGAIASTTTASCIAYYCAKKYRKDI